MESADKKKKVVKNKEKANKKGKELPRYNVVAIYEGVMKREYNKGLKEMVKILFKTTKKKIEENDIVSTENK